MFGIDVDDDALMAARSWRWLRARVLSLLDRPPRYLTFQSGDQMRIESVPTTRVGYALTPPKFE